MTGYDATEIAYRNGYEAGRRACEAEIVQLSEKCQRLEKERDAAIATARKSCDTCKREDFCMTDAGFPTLSACVSASKCNWEWRGYR